MFDYNMRWSAILVGNSGGISTEYLSKCIQLVHAQVQNLRFICFFWNQAQTLSLFIQIAQRIFGEKGDEGRDGSEVIFIICWGRHKCKNCSKSLKTKTSRTFTIWRICSRTLISYSSLFVIETNWNPIQWMRFWNLDIFLNDKHKIVFLKSPLHYLRFLRIQEKQACVLYVLDMDSHNLQVRFLET
jgi:hypothetical protein